MLLFLSVGKGNEADQTNAEQLRFASCALLCAWALHVRGGGWRGRLTFRCLQHSCVISCSFDSASACVWYHS